MATAASQPYIAKLGFADPDRSKDRHGLACEYLFERLLELEIAPLIQNQQIEYLRRLHGLAESAYHELCELKTSTPSYSYKWRDNWYSLQDVENLAGFAFQACSDAVSCLEGLSASYGLNTAKGLLRFSSCVSRPIKTGYNGTQTAGFADVLIKGFKVDSMVECRRWEWSPGIELYSPPILGEVKITKQPAETVLQQINYYRQHIAERVEKVYILTDYDCSDLQRITQGSDIKVFRLGKRFDDWIASRGMPSTPEL